MHVALHRGGELISIDPRASTILQRRSVCKTPHRIAFETATGLLHVACAESRLVSLPANSGPASRTLELETDLRDVIVRGQELWVTRFKSAELLRVTSDGES